MKEKHCGNCVHWQEEGKICRECWNTGGKKDNFKQLLELVEVPAELIKTITIGGTNR